MSGSKCLREIKIKSSLSILSDTGASFTSIIDCKSTNMSRLSPRDPTSFSRPDQVIVKHMNFTLHSDFKLHTLSGKVLLTVHKVVSDANRLILDVLDLTIRSVIDNASTNNLKYTILTESDTAVFGSCLTIELPKVGSDFVIAIEYVTSPYASGLQWLAPEQTADKDQPYVFSHFEAIAARSFVPCQDTPYVKSTYEAIISCPSNLKVVMSAISKKVVCDQTKSFYTFKQKVPVQSYLIAFAIGALESHKVGPRTTIYAEKAVIEAAVYEFANTENLLKTAEEICGPYVWGEYNILVLPPSFPFGGMENPCLTFVTPTLLAGDRSLVNVVSHEIAHSWTGNLVTNANFEHFWLNEGFTVFIERKINGRLNGEDARDFDAYVGLSALRETVNRLGSSNPLTSLVVDLTGVHPDEAFSSIPYEKGHLFLRYLEQVVGGPAAFEHFLRSYLDKYKFKSITSNEFKQFFEEYFKKDRQITYIDWNTWLHRPGMPPVIPTYNQKLAQVVKEKTEEFVNWDLEQSRAIPFGINDVPVVIRVQFMQEVFEDGTMTIPQLEIWEREWQMTAIKNAEIKFRWIRICIQAKWEEIVPVALAWINEVGRMKYTRPIYRDLYAWAEMRQRAVDNFKAHSKYMMYVSRFTIAKDLNLTNEADRKN